MGDIRSQCWKEGEKARTIKTWVTTGERVTYLKKGREKGTSMCGHKRTHRTLYALMRIWAIARQLRN